MKKLTYLKRYNEHMEDYIQSEEDANDEDKLNYIADLIIQGFTSGYEPTWTLNMESDSNSEFDDLAIANIASQVRNGMTSGEVITGEDEERAWWSIEIQ